MRVISLAALLLLLPACSEREPDAVASVHPALSRDPMFAGSAVTASATSAADSIRTDTPSVDPREIECDGVDQDGDGSDRCTPDADGDGVRESLDCDDRDPQISPLEVDVPCDGVDQNCNGLDECDSDGDGWQDRDDCDPRDARVRDECLPRVPAAERSTG